MEIKDVIARILAGDKQAYGQIVRAYGAMVRAALASHLRDAHLVEDLSQEVFVAAYWALESFDTSRDFQAWLRAITKNKLTSYLRRHYASPQGVESLSAQIHELLEPEVEKEQQEAQQLIEQLRSCMARHPEKDRQLITARYLEQESVGSMAQRMKTTVSAISSQLYRIRGQLRSCMEREVSL